jgi:phage terminase large subunit-like protein
VTRARAEARPMSRGERVIAFIERYCFVPEGTKAGKLIVLDPFEKKFIYDVYDNPAKTQLAILSMAKKNGKTAFIGALVICHVAGPEAVLNSQIVSGAMSREQAGLIFDYAVKMIRLNRKLAAVIRVVPSRKRLYGLARNVEFRAMAAVSKSTHGISPLVAILDEIGQVKGPKSDFVDAITTAQGAYDDAIMFVISTQAAEDIDLLSTMIDDAKEGDNPHTVCHVYEAPKDCDVLDRKAWAAANPALGTFRSLTDLEKLADKAKRMPSFLPTFRNFNLNQRVEATAPFITRDIWKQGDRDLVPHEGMAKVWCGLDLSSVADLTAFAALWEQGGQWNASVTFWTPEFGVADRAKRDKAPYELWIDQGFLLTTPGATVDYDFVAEQILEMTAGMRLQGMAFDRWRIDVFKAALKRQDATDDFISKMANFGQGYQSMSPAIEALESVALNGRLAHAAHPVLTMCARNARVVKDTAGNRKLDKRMRTGRIDGMVALVEAAGIAAINMVPDPSKRYQAFIV